MANLPPPSPAMMHGSGYLSKNSSSVFIRLIFWSGSSRRLPHLQYQTCLMFTIPCHAASIESPAIASEKEQNRKRQLQAWILLIFFVSFLALWCKIQKKKKTPARAVGCISCSREVVFDHTRICQISSRWRTVESRRWIPSLCL